jgi:hypothetical protein
MNFNGDKKEEMLHAALVCMGLGSLIIFTIWAIL